MIDEGTTSSGSTMTEIEGVIEHGTRREIAVAYAAKIRACSDEPELMAGPPWSDWNRAIGVRFGLKGLGEIKREAWRLVDAD